VKHGTDVAGNAQYEVDRYVEMGGASPASVGDRPVREFIFREDTQSDWVTTCEQAVSCGG